MREKAEEQTSEKSQLQKIQEGDHYAFEIIFKKYYESLTRFAWRYLGCEIEAEEVVQEVFATIWGDRKRFNIQGSLRSYLYKCVRNTSLNNLKSQNVRRVYDPIWMEESNGDSMIVLNGLETEDPDQILIKAIERAIEELPMRSRMLFKLHRYDGLTYEEIADVMQISVKTVESQMTRSLRFLRSRLSDLYPLLLFAALPF